MNKGSVYLAARYSRYKEMQIHAAELRALGYTVVSRWIDGNHQVSDAGLSDEAKVDERTRFAQEDLDDVGSANITISFTEPPRSTSSRGGRHVEFGIALEQEQLCIVVGFRENIFHCLPQVRFFPTWLEALESLR